MQPLFLFVAHPVFFLLVVICLNQSMNEWMNWNEEYLCLISLLLVIFWPKCNLWLCVYYLLFFPTSHRIVCVFAYHSIISLQRMKKKWRKKMFAQIQLYLPSWWSCLLSTNLVPTNCQYCCCCCCCCMNRESSFFFNNEKKNSIHLSILLLCPVILNSGLFNKKKIPYIHSVHFNSIQLNSMFCHPIGL